MLATALVVVTNYKYSNNLRVQILQYGTGIFFGIIGSVILVIAYFLPRAQHEPYNQPPKIQPLSSPTPDETSREVSTEDKKVGRKRSPIRWIVGIAVVAAIVSVLFVPLVPVEATFNVSEPYSRLATYEVTAASLTGHWDLTRGTYHTSEVAVRNTDVKGGTFVVTHYVYDTNGLFGTKTTNGYVGSGSTVTFAADFDTQFLASYRAEYSVIAPSISGENMVSRKGTAYKSIIDLWLHI